MMWTNHHQLKEPAKLPQYDDNRNRNTDFQLKILYVLVHICSGDGAAEVGWLLGLLGWSTKQYNNGRE